jgi:Transposase DDE domain
MGRKKKDELAEPDVRGTKYLKRVLALLGGLHGDATARDRAHNRTLFYDRYAALVLFSMFSPAVDSLRAIGQASALPKVRKLLGCPPAGRGYSLGSLSEAARVFDPALLEGVIAELGAELAPLAKDPLLGEVRGALTLVDGTLLKALPRLAGSAWKTSRTGTPMHGWRMHCQLDLSLGTPARVDVTDYCNSGESDEREVLRAALAGGRCYVMDRGYFAYALFDDIVAAGGDYVCRVKRHLAFEVVEGRPVTPAARAAGVVRDAVVRAGDGRAADRRPAHPVRLVWVEADVAPRAARGTGKPQGPPRRETLILATSMLDLPAELVAVVYKHRWAVELFFRFFKRTLGCRHLLSDDPGGVTIQCYAAVIACMLLTLWTGKKADRATWRMAGWFLAGLATEADVLAHANRPDNTGVKLAAKAALWKKLGY